MASIGYSFNGRLELLTTVHHKNFRSIPHLCSRIGSDTVSRFLIRVRGKRAVRASRVLLSFRAKHWLRLRQSPQETESSQGGAGRQRRSRFTPLLAKSAWGDGMLDFCRRFYRVIGRAANIAARAQRRPAMVSRPDCQPSDV